MHQQWYYKCEGETLGPVSRDDLDGLRQSGRVQADTLVIADGMRDWLPVKSIDQLARSQPVSGDPSSIDPPPAEPLSSPAQAPVHATTHRAAARHAARPRRPQQSHRWPLVATSLAAVAILAGLIGWFANSLNRPPAGQVSNLSSSKQETAGQVSNLSDSEQETVGQVSNLSEPERRTAGQVSNLSPPTSTPIPHPTSPSESTSQSPPETTPRDAVQPSAEVSATTPPAPTNPTRTTKTTSPTAADQSAPGREAASESVAISKPKPQQTVAREEKPQVLFQELDIKRLPKFSVLGTVMSQEIHYRILSELEAGPPDERGFRRVSQLVRDTRLVKADALSQAMFQASLERLKGWQFSYILNSRSEVIEIRGPDDGKKLVEVAPAGGKGLLLTSVMDQDGWKELAELSFFEPDPRGMENQSWTRQMTHDYQPLGAWYGETTFVPRGRQQDLLRVDFAHKLNYRPPPKGATAGGLAMAIRSAKFAAGVAGGTIYYDVQRQRVDSAQERFHVRGTLSTELLGQASNIEVDEQQTITVRVVEQNPWE